MSTHWAEGGDLREGREPIYACICARSRGWSVVVVLLLVVGRQSWSVTRQRPQTLRGNTLWHDIDSRDRCCLFRRAIVELINYSSGLVVLLLLLSPDRFVCFKHLHHPAPLSFPFSVPSSRPPLSIAV